MANDTLFFRKGTLDQLKNSPIINGAINVTTDEPGIYVDFDGVRKRVGDVIQVDSIDKIYSKIEDGVWTGVADDISGLVSKWSATALYYAIQENALLKFIPDATNPSDLTKGTWKQINGTTELTNAISELQKKAAANESAIATIRGELDDTTVEGETVKGLKSRLSDTEAAIVRLDGEQDTQDNRLTALEETVNGKAGEGGTPAVPSLREEIASLKAKDGSIDNAIAGVDGKVDALDTRVTTAENDIDALQLAVNGDGTENSSLAEKIAANTTAIGVNAEGIATNKAATEKNAGDIAGLQQSVADIEGILGDGDSAGTLVSRVATLEGEMDAVEKAAEKNATDLGALTTRVATAESTLTTHGTQIGGLQTSLGQTDEAVSGLSTRLGTAETNITNLTNNKADKTALQELSNTVDTKASQEDLNGLTTRVDTAETNISNIQTDLAKKANQSDLDKTNENLATTNSNLETTNTNVTNVSNRVTAVETTLNGDGTAENPGLVAEFNAYKSANDTLVATLATKKELTDEGTRLEKLINTEIDAANAMTFKNGVEKFDDLPTVADDEIQIGDTYVVKATFTENDVTYYAGDLLVATGTEVNGLIVSDLAWNHVETGYIESHNSKLSVTDNTVKLTSFAAGANAQGDLGTVQFKAADNTNLVVNTTTAGINGVVTLSMEWGSF